MNFSRYRSQGGYYRSSGKKIVMKKYFTKKVDKLKKGSTKKAKNRKYQRINQ